MLNQDIKSDLLGLARYSIKSFFLQQAPDKFRYTDPIYSEMKGAFVTLHKHKQLRGCIGYIKAYKSLLETIIEMSRAAAFRDPRFSPVTEAELEDLRIEISILSEMIIVVDTTEIELGRDGLLIEHPYGQGVLLPQVAVEWKWDKATFLKQLCRKAGLEDFAWRDKDARLYRFSAEVFSEEEK